MVAVRACSAGISCLLCQKVLCKPPATLFPSVGGTRKVFALELRYLQSAGVFLPADVGRHSGGELHMAARCYLHCARAESSPEEPLFWPWDRDRWRPQTIGRDMVRAGALFLAEIERCQFTMLKVADPETSDFVGELRERIFACEVAVTSAAKEFDSYPQVLLDVDTSATPCPA